MRPRSGSATCGDAAHGQSEDEQRDQAVDQQRLPLVPCSEVRPRERQHKRRGKSVQIVRSGGWSRARREHGRSSSHLHYDECLTDRQRSRVAAGN